MLTFVLQLLLAHLLGDFIFQPTQWVAHKEKHKIKSKYLYIHIAIHLISLLVVTQFNGNYLKGIVLLIVSHYCIDVLKLYAQKKKNKRAWFAIDQLLHLILIAIVVYLYFPYSVSISNLYSNQMLLIVIAVIMCTQVVSILMKVLFTNWQKHLYEEKKPKEKMSLPKAGSYIGMLERLFVFSFVLLNQWEAIGFLLAAKSIFRFGDLTKASDRKLTEYILIGTLLSFGFSILIAKIYIHLLTIF